ncbi:LytR/AlgR family response regulator transcription factor [Chitinophaga nivalis]|uniref:LytTR family transcriptional regulator n=1 Tax=Chitinophaga nivalis TaxID=2991709 RepID=A0ABT3IED2_9BACT|nr:LytTR family DNA-binding domain-containing protein [Chitinophaga nivalis]MCW3467987.1 LytTR family transcriptional regulator [Chitinophaga nivalis]MCW3482322.1 LytTR family transcriptional regulator [Chitinophaga nivalis]
MILNCIILGDEPDGFEKLENYIANIPFVYLVRRCSTMQQAASLLQTGKIHLLIVGNKVGEMANPLYASLEPKNRLPILMMAYPRDTSDAYEILLVKWLELPFTFTHFFQVMTELHNIIDMNGSITPGRHQNDHFVLRCEHRHEKIYYKDLQYVEVMNDCIMLHLADQKVVTTEKLDWIISQLPVHAFMRVHRWFVVGFEHITALEDNHVQVGVARIPLTTQMKEEVAKRYKLRG